MSCRNSIRKLLGGRLANRAELSLTNRQQRLCSAVSSDALSAGNTRPAAALPMYGRDVRQEIQRFDSSVNVTAAFTPPGTWYVYPEFHEMDKNSVFAKNWVGIGGAHNIPIEGNYMTGTLADEPYLIVRDYPDSIHYFYNLCRHHGTVLCDQHKGTATEFVCPYHAWKYNLDGKLTMAKRLRTIENFSARDNGLKKMSGTSWFGLLFLNLDGKAECTELHDKLDELKKRLNRLGCYEGKLTHVATKSFPVNCNWKVVIDNYLDGGYHVPHCHEALNDLLEDNSYKTEVYDGFSVQSSTGNSEESRVGLNSLYIHIYPNTFINRYGNWLDVNYVIPTGPESCEVVFDWYMDTDAYETMQDKEREITVAENLKNSTQVQDEDTVICERVQKGMRSRSFTHGRYAPLLEHAMHDFHVRLARDYNLLTDGTKV